MFPTLYQKIPIKYDPFSKIFHNNLKSIGENLQNLENFEKFGVTKKRESQYQQQQDSKIEINESTIINENENENTNRISNINFKSLGNTGYNNKDKDNSNFNNNNYVTSSRFILNFNNFNNKKKNLNFDGKKTYYDKNYLFQDNQNEENDIVSNFNIQKNPKYNQLIYTNNFSNKNKNYKNSNSNNKFAEDNHSYNNNFDSQKPYMHKFSTLENKEKSPFIDLKEDNTIKNSFYYSLRGKVKKNNLMGMHKQHLISNKNLVNLNTNSRENTINRMLLGNSFTNLSNANNIELSVDEANLYKEINPHGQYNYFNGQNQNSNMESSINDISTLRKYNEMVKNIFVNKENSSVDKKNLLENGKFNGKNISKGRDFLRNFNLINTNNSINSRSVKTRKLVNYNNAMKNENYYQFPKLKKPNQDNMDNVLEGIYNVVELKSKFKRKKR